MSHIGFNTDDYEPQKGTRRILPRGDYIMIITKDEFKTTKSGNGNGFLIDWQIVQGSEQGHTLKNWINHENPSETAQKIGREELRAIADACGIQSPKDTAQLYNIPMLVTLDVEYKTNEKTGQSEPYNNLLTHYQKLGDSHQQHTATVASNNLQPPADHPAVATPTQGKSAPWLGQAR